MPPNENLLLENTIRHHGVLLEHEVETILKTTVEAAGAEFLKLPKHLPCKQRHDAQNVEIDVHVEFLRNETPTRFWSLDDKDAPLNINGNSITLTTRAVTECKGHSRDGTLLVRKSVGESFFEPFRVEEKPTTPKSAWIKSLRSNDLIVDWGCFFQDELKDIHGEKIFKRAEEKSLNKFDKAIEQTTFNIAATLEQQSSLVGVSDLFRILPLVVTNTKIVLMEYAGNKVTLKYVPWVTYKNSTTGVFNSRETPAYQWVYVVQSQDLKTF